MAAAFGIATCVSKHPVLKIKGSKALNTMLAAIVDRMSPLEIFGPVHANR